MKREIIEELNNDDTFDKNIVIHKNATIYENYSPSPTHKVKSSIISLPEEKTVQVLDIFSSTGNVKTLKINRLNNNCHHIDIADIFKQTTSSVVGYGNYQRANFIGYDRTYLLSKLSNYGEKLYNVITENGNKIEEFKHYINKGYNFDTNFWFLGKLYIDIKQEKLRIIINFFKNFGFPFNNKANSNNDFPYYLIESKVIPSLLLIYTVNTIYENIKLLESKKTKKDFQNTLNNTNELDSSEKLIIIDTLNDITDELDSLKKLFNIDTNLFGNEFFNNQKDLNRLEILLDYYKIDLLDIINKYSNNFATIKQHYYFNYELESNTTIPISENLLDLGWYICKNKILSNFQQVKLKRCLCCGTELKDKQSKFCSSTCRNKMGGRKTTKKNKENRIRELCEKYKNHIFENSSINEKILEFKELISSGKVSNIEEHDWKISELKLLKKQIELAIQKNEYKMK